MKYYVVLKGHNTGIFTNRDECKHQVDGFLGAKYKSFTTEQSAQFARKTQGFGHKGKSSGDYLRQIMKENFEKSICTDAACPSNPGPIEYRGVIISTGVEIFNYGPLEGGSVNIAEFLAIIAGLKRLSQQKKYTILYSDSITAIGWTKKGIINTTIIQNRQNKLLFEIIDDAVQWLKLHSDRSNSIRLYKRPTSQRGQIPADFGRK